MIYWEHIWWPDKSFLMVTHTNESLSRCSGVMQGENPVLTLIKAIPAMASNLKSCLMNQWCRGGVRDNLPTGWRIFSEDQLKCFEFTGRYNTQLPRSKYLLEYWIWEILVFIDKHCGYNLYQECVIKVENFKSRFVRLTIWSSRGHWSIRQTDRGPVAAI